MTVDSAVTSSPSSLIVLRRSSSARIRMHLSAVSLASLAHLICASAAEAFTLAKSLRSFGISEQIAAFSSATLAQMPRTRSSSSSSGVAFPSRVQTLYPGTLFGSHVVQRVQARSLVPMRARHMEGVERGTEPATPAPVAPCSTFGTWASRPDPGVYVKTCPSMGPRSKT